MLVTRSRYEEMKSLKDAQILDRDKRIAELEAERRRLHDLVYNKNFGVQVFDSLPSAESPADQSSDLSEEEQQQLDLANQLAHIQRSRPSSLGQALTLVNHSNVEEAARRANPSAFVAKVPEAVQHFENAVAEAKSR